MNNKINCVLKIMAPVIAGITGGAVLFVLGEIDDAPGLCAIGIALCIGLLYWGLRNAHTINRHIQPSVILPPLIGLTGIIWIAQYLMGGVFDEPPGLILTGGIGSAGLAAAGCVNFVRMKRNETKRKKERVAARLAP
ncbi:MAG: hypothetical protein LBB61_07485 [Treponema sp.]|nr:hypothetical protein [Treponema sp.]